MDSAVTINNYLPQEILLKIFRYCSLKDLLNFRIVSKHWFELSRDNSLFRNVVFTNDLDTYEIYLIMKMMNTTCPLILKFFCRRDDTVDLFDSITTFLLSRLMKWNKQMLSELNNKLPLYYLYFDNCILGDCLSKLGCRCVLRTNNNKVSPVSSMEKFICSKNLKTTIKIRNCCTATIYSLLITFNFNEELFPKYVETLVISDISILCGPCCICDELNDMVSKCYNLVEFKFKNPILRESCRESIRYTYQNLCRYNKITILKISAQYLTDEDIKSTENLQDLKVLHLYSARQITRESLIALQNLKHIVSFIISENLLIQPAEWTEFFRNTPYMKAVERLGLDECLIDNSVIYRICEACKQLKKFSLNGCRDDTCMLTSESLISLFNACTDLKKVKLCYVDRELKMAVDDSSAKNIDVDFIPIN